MIPMPDKNNGVALARILHRFHVDLGDQRTGGVNDPQVAALAGLSYFRRHPVRTVDNPLAFRDLLYAINEDGPFLREFIHHVAIVYDLFADVDGPAKGFEGDANNVD